VLECGRLFVEAGCGSKITQSARRSLPEPRRELGRARLQHMIAQYSIGAAERQVLPKSAVR
jgi:hypothetical protein